MEFYGRCIKTFLLCVCLGSCPKMLGPSETKPPLCHRAWSHARHIPCCRRAILPLLAVFIHPWRNWLRGFATIAGVLYPTFQSAAVAAGLCESDQHYHETLQDALSFATAPRARHLLATMLPCCDISDPAHLWETFRIDLSEDLLRVCGTSALASNAALQDI